MESPAPDLALDRARPVSGLVSETVTRLAHFAFGNQQAILTFADQAFVSLTSFVTGVIVGRMCTRDEFGLYVLAFMVFYGVAELQANLLIGPYTVYHPRLSSADARQYRGVVLLAQTGFGLASMAVLFAVAAVLQRVAGIPPGLPAVLHALAIIVGCLLARDGVRRLCFAWLRTVDAWVLDAAVGAVQIGGLLVLAAAHHLSAITAIGAAGAAAGLVTAGWLLWQRREFQIRRVAVGVKARTLWSLGRWMSANALVSNATIQAYPWLITSMAGAEAMALVAASASVTTVVNPAIFGLYNYIGPTAAHALAAGGPRRLRALILKVSTLFLLAATPFCAAVLLFGERVVTLIYGSAYSHTGTIVALTALQLIPTGLSAVASRGLVALERADIDLKVNLLPVACLVVAAVWVIRPYGAVGAIAASLVGTALGAVARCWAFAQMSSANLPAPPRSMQTVYPGAVARFRKEEA